MVIAVKLCCLVKQVVKWCCLEYLIQAEEIWIHLLTQPWSLWGDLGTTALSDRQLPSSWPMSALSSLKEEWSTKVMIYTTKS